MSRVLPRSELLVLLERWRTRPVPQLTRVDIANIRRRRAEGATWPALASWFGVKTDDIRKAVDLEEES